MTREESRQSRKVLNDLQGKSVAFVLTPARLREYRNDAVYWLEAQRAHARADGFVLDVDVRSSWRPPRVDGRVKRLPKHVGTYVHVTGRDMEITSEVLRDENAFCESFWRIRLPEIFTLVGSYASRILVENGYEYRVAQKWLMDVRIRLV